MQYVVCPIRREGGITN